MRKDYFHTFAYAVIVIGFIVGGLIAWLTVKLVDSAIHFGM